MTLLEVHSERGDEAIAKLGLRHKRRRYGIHVAVTRFHATALHSLDQIDGWLAIDGTPGLSLPHQVAWTMAGQPTAHWRP